MLFVSNYGEGEERKITFAHFSQPGAKGELPILKVLGWDDADTALHLDGVAEVLTSKLIWPSDEKNTGAWREQWQSAFTIRHGEVIKTSKDLSIRLAGLGKAIRKRILRALSIETEIGPLTKLLKAFQAALVHDLDADGFADMYAQTIAYGLLSARITNPYSKTADDLAGQMRTNPFLKELMDAFLKVAGRRGKTGGPGIDFDEVGVGDVIELLDNSNMEAVLRDFGDRNPQEDPVIHFYELFLKEYDAKKRMQRGVFYTPRPVVSYIVRSVDELLRSEFSLEDGLADTATWGEMVKHHRYLKIPEGVSPEQTFIQVLDPACGTGTFLVEAIDLIHKTLVHKWKAKGHGEKKIDALWNEYVPKHLLPRLHGYELLMAPYAIAHVKVGLKLYETGYRFESDERARIYLTNALEPPQDFADRFTFDIPALAHEAQAVNQIKRDQRFTVVVGNPPYSKIGRNMGDWARSFIKLNSIDGVAVQSYYEVDGAPLNERKVWLQDDYVKFIRLAQYCIKRSNMGVYGYITNRGFLGNPTFNGMRQSLSRAFHRISILDLHGDTNVGEDNPYNEVDQNVFDIQQGVAISISRCLPHYNDAPLIQYAELWGSRDKKYLLLTNESTMDILRQDILLAKPLYLFVPAARDITNEFERYWLLPDIMPHSSSGVVTSKDAFVIGYSDDEVQERIAFFLDPKNSDETVMERLRLSENYAWRVSDARTALRKDNSWKKKFVDVLYRPFDNRRILLHGAVVWRTRESFMRQMSLNQNVGLLATRQASRHFNHAFCTRHAIEMKACSHDRNTELYPLWIFSLSQRDLLGGNEKRINLTDEFLTNITSSTNLHYSDRGRSDRQFGPIDALCYIYGILYSQEYRSRYKSQLLRSYPRIPVNPNPQLFLTLSRIGSELVALHLMESPRLNDFITTYIGPKNPEVVRVGWSNDTVWLDATATKKGQPAKPGSIGFRGVPEQVWNFHIGGYQVCEKWLKDRKGRMLSQDDIVHYQKVVVAINETIRLMKDIDEVIEDHGGWPRAFIKAEAPKDKRYFEVQMVAEEKKKYGGSKS
jgi:predicted helicase